MNHKAALPFALLFAVPNIVYAGVAFSTYSPTLTGASKTSNKAYAGLNWEIPGSIAPALVLGVRRAKVESDGDTRGADVSFAMVFVGGAKPGKLRLKGFTGKEDYQWELGGGYDFSNKGVFFGPSVNLPHASLGVDWQANPGLKPYITVHTIGEYNKPTGTPTCPSGGVYNGTTGLCEVGVPPT